jgi:hypothetical protein
MNPIDQVMRLFGRAPENRPEAEINVMDLFPNYAANAEDEFIDKVQTRLRAAFSAVRERSALEDIWDANDKMYRVKPPSDLDVKNRANEATGAFHVAVNQLVGIAFKTFTDNPENYKYSFAEMPGDEEGNTIRRRNSEIATRLLHRAMAQARFKRELRKALFEVYKNGTCFVAIPWEKRVDELVYRDKRTGQRLTKPLIRDNLPGFHSVPIDAIWLDENIDSIEGQPAVFIKSPVSWSDIVADAAKNKVALYKTEGDETLRDKFSKYREYVAASEFETPASDRADNADRDRQDRTAERYKHWVVWVKLPIDADGEWDEDSAERLFRVRIMGDPGSCEIVEIRRNVFPGGVPLVVAHQTPDSIGMYPVSLGEKAKTYYDQICTAVNQLIDNRSKNVRRPIVYDPMRIDISKYDWGHSNGIPCDGDVRSAFAEMQLADMTATIMPTIQYCELKLREIMNTTDAVMGMALGGRTSASEYVGARAAATTPIFSDLAGIEDDLIGEYMRRFIQYVHVFMTLEDIVDQVGPVGAEFQFDMADIYTVELRGVTEAMDKAMRIQNLMQLYSMTQDATARSRIMLRIAEAMDTENPSELVPVVAKDQAVKAALYENNSMLVYGEWDAPEPGEPHDIHLPVHKQAMWSAQRDKNPNVKLLEQHVADTEQLKRSEQAMAGSPTGMMSGQSATGPALPGSESGQAISAQFGAVNAGSPIPASSGDALPGAPPIIAQE